MAISTNGGSNPTSVIYNGQNVTEVLYNGTHVWPDSTPPVPTDKAMLHMIHWPAIGSASGGYMGYKPNWQAVRGRRDANGS